ncbi:hemolysin family protein [Rubrimonas cliftonensis]|uniref:Hemolysin, contains CBS domains n=1 Tax=Rubrimonas cliftonensis TaxID=89524 RepID=A0A1H4E618_9RHOB|nr:hemolysin family protein [Rubrimonas cliftonensis]SEA80463.1 Hemolysin, contains CBS domains [Rubrimonas cliftonensis]
MTIDWTALSDPEIIARLALQLVLFAASATFSMSETCLFSLREADLRRLEDAGRPGGRRLRALLDEPRRLIVSILCGNELINILATINLTGVMLALFGSPEAAGLVNTLVMLPALLILCEITPKTVAVTAPVPIATRIVEPVMTVWVRIVAPLRWLVRLASDRITTALIGESREERNLLSTDDFEAFLRDVEGEGAVSAGERRLIVNLIEAVDTPITQIMVPRPQVAFLSADLPPAEMLEAFRRLRHRRVPVYRRTRDAIVGFLREERVLEACAAAAPGVPTIEALLAPASFAPTTQTVGELAETFKNGDHHAVLVVNEFGGVDGLVSADDVFGYLTRGQAVYLEAHADIAEPAPGVFRCAGLTPIGALRRATGLPLESADAVATVGGLILALMRRLPKVGETVADGGVAFRVEAMSDLLVTDVLIAPEGHPVLDEPAAPPGEEAA